MYKIIEKNQIIDVIETPCFVKYLPRTKKTILVDERQANGIISSDSLEIYHIANTKNVFDNNVKSVQYIKIEREEYDSLTKQLKANRQLANRVLELEKIVEELKQKILV